MPKEEFQIGFHVPMTIEETATILERLRFDLNITKSELEKTKKDRDIWYEAWKRGEDEWD